MPEPSATPPSTLKDSIFPPDRYREVGRLVRAIHPAFDQKQFLRHALHELDALSLMQRLRRMTESLHSALPGSFQRNLDILRELAPRLPSGFVTLFLPDYVARYGRAHTSVALGALKHFTCFGSAEFAIREFLRDDLKGTLATLTRWTTDENEHVRRLASEGTRPRLPWSFHLPAIAADPALAAPILEALRADPSLYVRKSVANHLNDVTRAHPDWVLKRIGQWPLDNAHTAWIARRALRTLIKAGDRRALALIGAGEKARVQVLEFKVGPARVQLGERITFTLALASTAKTPQRLVVDCAVHYVKKTGASAAKVFKWKETTVGARETIELRRSQVIKDFTTRRHYPGRHVVDLLVNGDKLASASFDLRSA
ncbi:MAG: DNA alkylation repair protein [Pseudomonadota bacterium]|nr:DNA alkylation repair protein [Pseudomonadota bacterium]